MTFDTLVMKKDHPTKPGWWYEVQLATFGKAKILRTDGFYVEDNW